MKPILYKNIQISYSDIGIGKVVLLLHGFLENKQMFDAFIPEITKTNRIITVDLLGHGNTPCIGYVHTMEDQAEMIKSLITQLNVSKVIVIGHSMGGYIALALMDLYPNLVEGLILLNSSAMEDSHERKINRNRGIKVAQTDYATLVQLSVRNLFALDSKEKLISEIEKTKKEALKTPLQGYIAAQEGMKNRKNRLKMLESASIPKVLILGRRDPVLNYEETKKKHEKTSVQLITFENGHMSTLEDKAELQIFFTNFLIQFG